jgi:hypothetical protein
LTYKINFRCAWNLNCNGFSGLAGFSPKCQAWTSRIYINPNGLAGPYLTAQDTLGERSLNFALNRTL